MVLHYSNFEIPARFLFRPFQASWLISIAEVVGWWEPPGAGRFPPIFAPVSTPLPEKERVLIRFVMPTGEPLSEAELGVSPNALGLLLSNPYVNICEVVIDRVELPDGILHPHENRRTAPDISERQFDLLVCPNPEFASLFLSLEPGIVAKNARVMRDEFFGLKNNIEETCKFLNRWGHWNVRRGYYTGVMGLPDPQPFGIEFPHLLWKERDKYSKALVGNPRAWLSTCGGLIVSQIDKPPYFVMERFSCASAVHDTITIDHLRGAKFGFCKRCRKMFERESLHKKNYCSRQCIQAAGVQRWREKQKKESRPKGRKDNATRKS